MKIKVRISELLRGEPADRRHCAIALATQRTLAGTGMQHAWTGLHQTTYTDARGVEISWRHTLFGRALVMLHDVSELVPPVRWLLLPWLWLPVINVPEATFAKPPDRIIEVPEPEQEAWQLPQPQQEPVPMPVETPVEEPERVPA